MTGTGLGHGPPSRRRLLGVLLAGAIAGLLCAVVLPSSLATTASKPALSAAQASEGTPKLIKHGWDVPTPAYVKANVKKLEKLPFDGLTVQASLSHEIQSQRPVTYARLKAALRPVAVTKFTTLRHNFLMVYSTPAGDLFGDWTVPVRNFRTAALAAREAGFTGIFYDNEEYFGSSLEYPGNCAGHSLSQCQAQAQLRGRQVMEAVRSVWPSVRILVAHGPSLSSADTPSQLKGIEYNDVAFANPLLGPFFVGLVQGSIGSASKVIDGGEIYTARSARQFQTIKAWQKQTTSRPNRVIPANLRSAWPSTLSSSFGVYDLPSGGVSMNSKVWRTTLANALATSDEFVWAYTERYNWTGVREGGKRRVPSAWVKATRKARADAQRQLSR